MLRSPARFFFRGGGRGGGRGAILILTIATIGLPGAGLKQNFLSFTQLFCFTIKMILREKHNQESATFKCYWVTEWDALHFLLDILLTYSIPL